MEESERRRDRLRALRLEAEQQPPPPGAVDGAALPAPVLEQLSEPLGNHEASFDFYTDPLAVYAGAKRKSGLQPQLFHRVAVSGVHQEGRLRLPVPGISAPDVPSHAAGNPTPGFAPSPYGYPGPPNFYARRGRGSRGYAGSRGRFSRHSEGRGVTNAVQDCSEGPISAELRPELFYSKSMLENPWRHLGPKPP